MPKPIMVVGTSAQQRRSLAAEHFGNRYALVFISPDIDEKGIRDTDATLLTRRIALAKMKAVQLHIEKDSALSARLQSLPGSVVVTFDQVVVWNDAIREKPADSEECKRFIRSYSNSSVATVQTTVLYRVDTMKQDSFTNNTMTYYGELPDDLTDRVIGRDHCLNSAGALVVEDSDMLSRMIRIDPGTMHEVQGMCARAVEQLLCSTQ